MGETSAGMYAEKWICPPAPFNGENLNDVSEKLRLRVTRLIKTAGRTRLGADAVRAEMRRGVLAKNAEEGLIRHEALLGLYRQTGSIADRLEVSAENVCASLCRLEDVKNAQFYANMEFCVYNLNEDFNSTIRLNTSSRDLPKALESKQKYPLRIN